MWNGLPLKHILIGARHTRDADTLSRRHYPIWTTGGWSSEARRALREELQEKSHWCLCLRRSPVGGGWWGQMLPSRIGDSSREAPQSFGSISLQRLCNMLSSKFPKNRHFHFRAHHLQTKLFHCRPIGSAESLRVLLNSWGPNLMKLPVILPVLGVSLSGVHFSSFSWFCLLAQGNLFSIHKASYWSPVHQKSWYG